MVHVYVRTMVVFEIMLYGHMAIFVHVYQYGTFWYSGIPQDCNGLPVTGPIFWPEKCCNYHYHYVAGW